MRRARKKIFEAPEEPAPIFLHPSDNVTRLLLDIHGEGIVGKRVEITLTEIVEESDGTTITKRRRTSDPIVVSYPTGSDLWNVAVAIYTELSVMFGLVGSPPRMTWKDEADE